MIDFEELKKETGFYSYGISKTEYQGLGYAISLVFRLSDFIVDNIKDGPTYEYFHHYRTVNSAIDRAIYLLGTKIQEEGYRYLPVAASQTVGGHASMRGLFSHKRAAARAGLGVIGRNALFIANGAGPKVRLGTIFTDMPFADAKEETPKGCIGCGKCASLCPAGAIYNVDFDPNNPQKDLVNRTVCSDYMKKAYQHIGRGSVCGICMANCPEK